MQEDSFYIGFGWYWAKEDQDSDLEIVGVNSTGKARRVGDEEIYDAKDLILLERIQIPDDIQKKAREYVKNRKERAEEEDMKIEKIDQYLYKVKGKYFVEIDDGTCTCPDFEYRGNKCKHILAVEKLEEKDDTNR